MNKDVTDPIRQRLTGNHSPNTEGEWEIYGEDPNCDMGGHHSNPFLGNAKGRYQDVVEYALTLPGFIGWGYGGSIKLRVIPNIVSVPKGFSSETLKDLYARKTKLELELAAVEEKIKNLDVDYE